MPSVAGGALELIVLIDWVSGDVRERGDYAGDFVYSDGEVGILQGEKWVELVTALQLDVNTSSCSLRRSRKKA